jgi:2-dehydropantoate 2-reductase
VSARYVVYGAGAIGGVVGARLAQAGHEVALIARGAHLEAIRTGGLRLITPAEDVTLQIPAADDPAQLRVGRDGDVVLLCVKGQDTVGALQALRAAGADDVPIVCLQNGVENERAALRRFPEVYGAVVIAPTSHLEPGVVEASGARLTGFIDVGRYPSGADGRAEMVAEALCGSRFRARAVADVMPLKYAKLLMNLGNVVGALFAEAPERDELGRRARTEGEATLAAAGIAYEDPAGEQRREDMGVAPIPGRPRGGSSTWQSLARGSASQPPTIETDYLNGEISLLGRLHGVATPINDRLCRLAGAHARRGGAPGELDAADVLAGLQALAS